MSGLRRINNGPQQHDDNPLAQRSAREYLQFILANGEYLLKVRGGKKYLADAKDIAAQVEDFTPNQLSYIDVLYEKTMKGWGEESFSATYRPKRRIV